MKLRNTLGMLMLMLIMAGSAWAGDVTQGRFVQTGAKPNMLVLEEYDINFTAEHPYGMPTGIMSEFDVAQAKIGINPEPGDILRIVYTDQGGTMKAIKVMNVSKQDLRKK
jgi:hypothetical protein